MSKKPTIRLKIRIGDVEHEMGADEVKALRDALNELYPDPLRLVRHEYVPVNPWRDRWVYGGTPFAGSVTPSTVGAIAGNASKTEALNVASLELKALVNT